MNNTWISFDTHYAKGPVEHYVPGLYWLELPEDFDIPAIEEFKKSVFRYAIHLARQARTPVLTYPPGEKP